MLTIHKVMLDSQKFDGFGELKDDATMVGNCFYEVSFALKL